MRNPQTSVAADVMGRIDHALHGGLETLRRQIHAGVEDMLRDACARADKAFSDLDALVVTGNTTMLYLLTGRNPEALSHAPFVADHLFDQTVELFSRSAYLPACINAFVGADISCAVMASGQCESEEISLLADIGTNGEIACGRTAASTSPPPRPAPPLRARAFPAAAEACAAPSTACASPRTGFRRIPSALRRPWACAAPA